MTIEQNLAKLVWLSKRFDALGTHELYEILALRTAVFVVEQNCPYQELDGKDQASLHVVGYQDGLPVAYTRILPPGISYDEVSIGRVVTAASVRGSGTGRTLMAYTMKILGENFGNVPVRISAQSYLRRFYESFGFVAVGEEYLEDDIPHIEMLRQSELV